MIGEQKFIQTQLTVLVYVILLFYLKNAVISSMDIPRKLLNYVKVYYSFLLLITIVGFFRSLLILLHIGIAQWVQRLKFFWETGEILDNKEKSKVNFEKKAEEYEGSTSVIKKKTEEQIVVSSFRQQHKEIIDNIEDDRNSLEKIDTVKRSFENIEPEWKSRIKEMECAKRKIHQKRAQQKEEKFNMQMNTTKTDVLRENNEEQMRKMEENGNEQGEDWDLYDDNSTQDEIIKKTKYNDFFKKDNGELANRFLQILHSLGTYTEENTNEDPNDTRKLMTQDFVHRSISDTSSNDDTIEEGTQSENSLLSNGSETNNKQDKMKLEKIPLKSILKKKKKKEEEEESNTLDHINKKNTNSNKRKIRFNKDVETFFFEKNSFEEDAFHDRRSIYKFLESYNIANVNVLGYNLRDHLKLAVHDILNPVFDFKDRLFNWF